MSRWRVVPMTEVADPGREIEGAVAKTIHDGDCIILRGHRQHAESMQIAAQGITGWARGLGYRVTVIMLEAEVEVLALIRERSWTGQSFDVVFCDGLLGNYPCTDQGASEAIYSPEPEPEHEKMNQPEPDPRYRKWRDEIPEDTERVAAQDNAACSHDPAPTEGDGLSYWIARIEGVLGEEGDGTNPCWADMVSILRGILPELREMEAQR